MDLFPKNDLTSFNLCNLDFLLNLSESQFLLNVAIHRIGLRIERIGLCKTADTIHSTLEHSINIYSFPSLFGLIEEAEPV